jgi:hypothetical protein
MYLLQSATEELQEYIAAWKRCAEHIAPGCTAALPASATSTGATVVCAAAATADKKKPAAAVQQKKQNLKQSGDDEETKGVIVQTKYDGDRLQAHVVAAGGGTLLFTRRGVSVTSVYSSIAEALESGWRSAAPCVLDGELIVVDVAGGRPLAWSNEKWRHNHRNAAGEANSESVADIILAEEAADDDDAVVMLEYPDAALSRVWEDAADISDVSFVPRAQLR